MQSYPNRLRPHRRSIDPGSLYNINECMPKNVFNLLERSSSKNLLERSIGQFLRATERRLKPPQSCEAEASTRKKKIGSRLGHSMFCYVLHKKRRKISTFNFYIKISNGSTLKLQTKCITLISF